MDENHVTGDIEQLGYNTFHVQIQIQDNYMSHNAQIRQHDTNALVT